MHTATCAFQNHAMRSKGLLKIPGVSTKQSVFTRGEVLKGCLFVNMQMYTYNCCGDSKILKSSQQFCLISVGLRKTLMFWDAAWLMGAAIQWCRESVESYNLPASTSGHPTQSSLAARALDQLKQDSLLYRILLNHVLISEIQWRLQKTEPGNGRQNSQKDTKLLKKYSYFSLKWKRRKEVRIKDWKQK